MVASDLIMVASDLIRYEQKMVECTDEIDSIFDIQESNQKNVPPLLISSPLSLKQVLREIVSNHQVKITLLFNHLLINNSQRSRESR
jgi:hypothetical protein